MIEFNSDLTIIKRLVENSEQKLFPRMKKRKQYLDELLKENDVPEIRAEIELNNLIREHIQTLMNYSLYMEAFIKKNITKEIKEETQYVKVLEHELLYEFRRKNNIAE
jgi:hypothetical protein